MCKLYTNEEYLEANKQWNICSIIEDKNKLKYYDYEEFLNKLKEDIQVNLGYTVNDKIILEIISDLIVNVMEYLDK